MIKQLQVLDIPDWGQLAEEAVRRSPRLSSLALQGALAVFAPHQRRLGLQLQVWDKRYCEARMRLGRSFLGLTQNAGTNDFGAAGELVAGLVILRNLHILKYRFQLKEINVVTDREPSKELRVSCSLDPQSFARLKMSLSESGHTTIQLKSDIIHQDQTPVAHVRSVWSITKRQ